MNKFITKTFLAALVFCYGIFSGCEDFDHGLEHHSGGNSIKVEGFGNPYVAGAVEDKTVQISDLKINGKRGLSYSWKLNDLSVWGIPYNETDALAIAGYLTEDNTYRCAKFDWISSSRRTRDFNNINGGYNGWEPEKFHSAKKRCFFIMSKDGKRRTNIITD